MRAPRIKPPLRPRSLLATHIAAGGWKHETVIFSSRNEEKARDERSSIMVIGRRPQISRAREAESAPFPLSRSQRAREAGAWHHRKQTLIIARKALQRNRLSKPAIIPKNIIAKIPKYRLIINIMKSEIPAAIPDARRSVRRPAVTTLAPYRERNLYSLGSTPSIEVIAGTHVIEGVSAIENTAYHRGSNMPKVKCVKTASSSSRMACQARI